MKIKHLFVINPVAGVKCCVEQVTNEIKRAFILNTDKEDEKYEITLTKGRGDAISIVKSALEKAKNEGIFTRIYACGGDGTLNEVINGCVGYENSAVCPVPVGSGNDFIKVFTEIPKEKFLNLSACVRGKIQPCDLIKVGEKYSINIVSMGLDAVTGKRQGYFKKVPLVSGPFAYKLALGTSFVTSMKNKIKFIVDDEILPDEYEDMTLAVVGNGQWYGGGFKAAPLAKINDGLMDFLLVKAVSRMTFLKSVSSYKKGEHIGKFPFMKYMTCKKIKAVSDKPFAIQYDGEVEYINNPEIEIVPSAINLIIPE